MARKDTNESFDLKNITKYKRVGEYLGSKVKIEFLCPKCSNIWLVSPCVILVGDGCPNCAKNKKDNNDSIDKKLLERNIKYKRIGTYINSCTKINFLCYICNNLWLISPTNIFSGYGCPSCSTHGFNQNEKAYLYFIQIEDFLKVGITNREPSKRYKELTNKEVIEIKVISGLGKDIKSLEDKIHKIFKHYYPKEKLKSGNTECFPLSLKNEILSHIM